jgi:hypothetical protein
VSVAVHHPSESAARWARSVLGRVSAGYPISPVESRGGVALRVAEVIVPLVVERLEAQLVAEGGVLAELDAEGARVRAALGARR